MCIDRWNGAEERMGKIFQTLTWIKDLVAIRMEWLKDFNLNYPSSPTVMELNICPPPIGSLPFKYSHFPRNHDSVKRSIMGNLSPPPIPKLCIPPPRDEGICHR